MHSSLYLSLSVYPSDFSVFPPVVFLMLLMLLHSCVAVAGPVSSIFFLLAVFLLC